MREETNLKAADRELDLWLIIYSVNGLPCNGINNHLFS